MPIEYTSYLNNLDNISVFNSDTFNKTLNKETGAYKVIIEAEGSRTLSKDDEGIYVHGVLKGGINLNTTSNWGELGFDSALGDLVCNDPLLVKIREAAKIVTQVGGVNVESDLQSKKFYTGGSYLSLPISFKVLDDDNTGKALKAYITLLALSMPRNHSSIKLKDVVNNLIERLPDGAEKVVKKVKNEAFSFVEKLPYAVDSMFKNLNIDNGIYYTQDARQGIRNVTSNAVDQIVNEELRLTESPTTIKISIGNWLVLENMIIDSVNATFSDNNSEVGPQSVEIELGVSTRNKLILGEDGIINGRGRVKIVNKGNNVTVKDSSGTFA